MVDNKKIAKNTIYMYVRMIFVMAISLYTSRVVLNTLGVDDYGTYQVVGGIVGLLAFLNLTLNQGTSRFLMFELGKGDKGRLKDMFSTLLSTHILLAIIVVVLAETIGLWFVYNKLIIPAERLSAAVFAYHLSILTVFFMLSGYLFFFRKTSFSRETWLTALKKRFWTLFVPFILWSPFLFVVL